MSLSTLTGLFSTRRKLKASSRVDQLVLHSLSRKVKSVRRSTSSSAESVLPLPVALPMHGTGRRSTRSTTRARIPLIPSAASSTTETESSEQVATIILPRVSPPIQMQQTQTMLQMMGMELQSVPFEEEQVLDPAADPFGQQQPLTPNLTPFEVALQENAAAMTSPAEVERLRQARQGRGLSAIV